MRKNLIFLHGGPGFRDYLQPYFHPLSDQFRCFFYSQARGPSVTIDDLVAQLLVHVQARPEAVLVGHSWGGVLAVEFARRYENLLSGVALLCAGLTAPQWHEYTDDLERLGLQEAPDEQLFLVPEDIPAGGKVLLDKLMADFSSETFESLYRSYVKSMDLLPALAALKLGVTNIFAEMDLRFPPRIPRSFRPLNPRIVDHEIKGAGHFPFLQARHREEILKILRMALFTS